MSKKRRQGLEYLPTAGVRTDFKRFMNKFLSNNTVRYEQFSEVWRERSMSYLCAGRGTDREAREFIERVLMIAQEYFLPPYQFQVRVGGLYMLYAIFQIQPLIPKVKLRMTPTQWQETMFFQQQAAQQNHLDVVYVFQRLLQEQAFLFCYTPSEMSIHSNIKDVEDREENLADNLKEEKTAVANLFNYESLEKLSYVQDQYQQMKIGLAGQNATKPDKSLDVVQGELAEDIVVLLQAFKEKVSTFSKQGQRAEVTSQEKEPEPEAPGTRRHLLKTQAYNQLTVHPDKRHNLVVVSNSSSSKEASTSAAGTTTNVSKQRPVLGISSSDDTDDDDYIPPKSLNSDSQRQVRQGDKLKSPQGKRAAARDQTKAVNQVTALSLNVKDLEKSQGSMPVIAVDDTTSTSHIQAMKQSRSRWPSVGNNVQTLKLAPNKEHCLGSTTTELPLPVKKRGRPRKYSNSNEIMEDVGLKTQLYRDGKENPSQINRPSVSIDRSYDTSNTILLDEDHNSVKNKVAFKWKNSGKVDQFAVAKSPPKIVTHLEKLTTERVLPARKRGRPRLVYDPTQPVTEIIVYPNPNPPAQQSQTTKYELVYFPTGMKISSDPKRAKKVNSDLETNKILETPQKMTSGTKQIENHKVRKTTTTVVKNAISTSPSKITRSAKQVLMSETVVEDIATNAVPMAQSPSRHKADINKPSEHTPTSGKTSSTQQNNTTQPVKLTKSTTDPADNPIQRLKERCKRKLEESKRRESLEQLAKGCTIDGKYAKTSNSNERPVPSVSLVSDQQKPVGACTTVGSKTASDSTMKYSQSSTVASSTPTKKRGRPRSKEGPAKLTTSFEFRFI